MKNVILLLCNYFLVSYPVGIFSQEGGMLLSIETLLDDYAVNSPQAISEGLKYKNQLLEFENYKKSLLPSLSFNFNPVSFNRSLRQLQNPADGSYTYVEDYSNSTNTGLSIRQKVPFTGGELSFGSSLNYFNEFSFDRHSFSTTPLYVSYTQNLFGSRKNFEFERSAKYKGYQLNMIRYCGTISGIQHEALNLFMDVFLNKLESKLSYQNQQITDTLLTITKQNYANGGIVELDLKQIELQHLNNVYLCENAIRNYQFSLQRLSTFLGLQLSDSLHILEPEYNLPHVLDVEQALFYFRQNSSFSLDQQLKKENAERNLYAAKLANRINASINLNYGLNQYGDSFYAAYSRPNVQQSVQIGLQIPVCQWGINRNKIKIAKNTYITELMDIEQSELKMLDEIKEKVNNYNHAIRLWKIAERTYILAQEQYRLTVQKFGLGKISAYEISSVQREQSEAMKKYYHSVKEAWDNYFTIRSLTLYDYIRHCNLLDILVTNLNYEK